MPHEEEIAYKKIMGVSLLERARFYRRSSKISVNFCGCRRLSNHNGVARSLGGGGRHYPVCIAACSYQFAISG